MRFIRAFLKLILFLSVTLFLYSVIMFCLVGSVVGLNYEKIRGHLLRFWGKCICKIIGIHVNVKNDPPEPPFLLVSNHISYMDIFVLFSRLRCLFVAKSDVKAWPFIGFIVRTCGILFIDRERKRDVTRVNELISKNINENQGIIIFPEGTTSPGMEILSFRPPLLEYPASMNFPVSYVAISYETPDEEIPAYQSICWWDETPFFVHFFNLLKMKQFNAKLNFGKAEITDNDRKQLALKLQNAVQSEFIPVIEKEKFNNRYHQFEPAVPFN